MASGGFGPTLWRPALVGVAILVVFGGVWSFPSVTSLCDRFEPSALCTASFEIGSGEATSVPSPDLFPTHTLALSPDGREAAIVLADKEAQSSGLFVVDLDTGSITETLVSATDGQYVRAPAWSPDGLTIAAAVSLDGQLTGGAIMQFDVATGDRLAVAAEWNEGTEGGDLSPELHFWISCRDFGLAFSVDGSHVACSSSAVDLTDGDIQLAHEVGTFLDYGVGRSFVNGATGPADIDDTPPIRFELSVGEFPYSEGRSASNRFADRTWSPATMAMHPSQQGVLAVRRSNRSGWLPRWRRPWGVVQLVDVPRKRILADVSVEEPIATAAWSHDGTRVVLATPDATLYILDLGSVERGAVLQLDEVAR